MLVPTVAFLESAVLTLIALGIVWWIATAYASSKLSFKAAGGDTLTAMATVRPVTKYTDLEREELERALSVMFQLLNVKAKKILRSAQEQFVHNWESNFFKLGKSGYLQALTSLRLQASAPVTEASLLIYESAGYFRDELRDAIDEGGNNQLLAAIDKLHSVAVALPESISQSDLQTLFTRDVQFFDQATIKYATWISAALERIRQKRSELKRN